jgi:hypothetical protein
LSVSPFHLSASILVPWLFPPSRAVEPCSGCYIHGSLENSSAQPNNRGLKVMRKYAFLLTAALMAAPSVQAAQTTGDGPNAQQFYLGAGLGINSISNSDDGLGFQFFGGYHAGRIANNLEADIEVGYMDTGNMEESVNTPFGTIKADARAKGLWAAGVARYAINPGVDLIGRVGYDFGDDDGFLVGVGVGFDMSKQSQLRVEYVARDNVDSIQLNLTFDLK